MTDKIGFTPTASQLLSCTHLWPWSPLQAAAAVQVLMSDTVGFIQKLPPQLVAAFRATLEEIREAALILHVVDISHPNAAAQSQAVIEARTCDVLSRNQGSVVGVEDTKQVWEGHYTSWLAGRIAQTCPPFAGLVQLPAQHMDATAGSRLGKSPGHLGQSAWAWRACGLERCTAPCCRAASSAGSQSPSLQVLDGLRVDHIPTVTVWNKLDAAIAPESVRKVWP